VLDSTHSEGEDDHRQGETAWSFAPEICLLLGAQLELSQRLLAGLVVKPQNMRRNLERSGGVVLSEAVMMALAGSVGRDRAHALLLEISRQAQARGVPFSEAVSADPAVRRLLPPRRLAAALDFRNSLGQAGRFVDAVLRAYARRPGRKGPRRRVRS
jgi:adenylosuccinate lyase